jgi:prolyl 4-hydroxylase
MVQHCRSKMSVKPMKTQAVLFYSQKRLGEMDSASIHGGCPVLQGSKWAANL